MNNTYHEKLGKYYHQLMMEELKFNYVSKPFHRFHNLEKIKSKIEKLVKNEMSKTYPNVTYVSNAQPLRLYEFDFKSRKTIKLSKLK